MIRFVFGNHCIKQVAALATIIVCSLPATSQTKELTNEQYFKGNFKGITQQLPFFKKWVSDGQFIMNFNGKDSLIDCKTGRSSQVVAAPVEAGGAKEEISVITKGNDIYLKQNETETA